MMKYLMPHVARRSMMNVTATTIFVYMTGLLYVDAQVAYDLGYIEIDLRSTQPANTNKLLHAVLSVTANFTSKAFAKVSDKTDFKKVACSIHSFKVGGSAGNYTDEIDTSPFSALVTITGKALFNTTTKWTQPNVTNFMSSIFDVEDADQSFLYELETEKKATPFLSNLTYVTVRVNGDVVAEEISDDTNRNNEANINSDAPALAVWMIALIGGLGAFVLVLCAVITCICCIPLEDDATAKVKLQTNQLGQNGTHPTRTDSKMDENHLRTEYIDNSPSEAKSIGSQDSSLFTYNPKSVRSFDSKKSFNSYFTYGTQGVEMDVATWHANTVSNNIPDEYTNSAGTSISAHQISFNQDISAIEAKKGDLSLIQEDEENESTIAGSVSVSSAADVASPLPAFVTHSPPNETTSNTVASSSPSRASGKYKSLLANLSHGCKSTTGSSNTCLAQHSLTTAAERDMMMEADDEENGNVVELYSRDSQSTGSGSQSTNGSKKNTNGVTATVQQQQQPLSAALAAGPQSIIVQNPVAIYNNNNGKVSTKRSSSVHNKRNDDNDILCRPSDEDTDTESSYGPSYYEPKPRLHLGGTAHDVLNDLNDLSAQIDEIRSSHSSGTSSTVSGRTAIRLRRDTSGATPSNK